MSSKPVLRLLAISGSLRSKSTNTGLLRACQALSKDARFSSRVQVDIADISAFPLYNGDLDPTDSAAEDTAWPAAVQTLRDQLAKADGILIATPEYNYSFSGVLKNAIDWVSRGGSPISGKAVALMGSGGGGGTVRSQLALRQVGVFLNWHFLNKPEVFVRRWGTPAPFDGEGNVVDAATIENLAQLLESFESFIHERKFA
mmetsp:Transcript_37677/g.94724  ORF Transcript_37677/g.94724 Transcript_37677/m.94724 type:complete len:201 (-) Transcript_37677:1105-1707(-)|eukprot:CAMPEP_0177631590 /NCGR_PEP_ID=MMETSP0447-20121125/1832_1 /TAXON_ID=0 /ORGANISM="Stygamoeba regulata, Strain BSH-02190019" /LENGTH=200 /DNA_ID=CAMNT_0019133087 /DNA_START=86 /DNA_END=688 /DNA_ORIENTATION=+